MADQYHIATDEERLQTCRRQYDEASRDLDDAQNDVNQWKHRHPNYNPLDFASIGAATE
jgi:hypothetical protein